MVKRTEHYDSNLNYKGSSYHYGDHTEHYDSNLNYKGRSDTPGVSGSYDPHSTLYSAGIFVAFILIGSGWHFLKNRQAVNSLLEGPKCYSSETIGFLGREVYQSPSPQMRCMSRGFLAECLEELGAHDLSNPVMAAAGLTRCKVRYDKIMVSRERAQASAP